MKKKVLHDPRGLHNQHSHRRLNKDIMFCTKTVLMLISSDAFLAARWNCFWIKKRNVSEWTEFVA